MKNTRMIVRRRTTDFKYNCNHRESVTERRNLLFFIFDLFQDGSGQIILFFLAGPWDLGIEA